MYYSLCFAAFFLGLASSAAIRSSFWLIPCPADKLSCDNGTDIGFVGFESPRYPQLEHAKEGAYKDLVCYPQNFCSMRWLKDGIPFPWEWSEDVGVSQGVCNSTLTFRRTGLEAEGVYTCEVTGANGTTISRNITLRVKAKPPRPPPIVVAGDLCANRTAAVGSNVTFRCEIYVGEEDSSNYAYWAMEVAPDIWDFPGLLGNVALNDTIIQQNTENERPGYLMSKLQIDNVSTETYVRYKLHVYNSRKHSVTNFYLQEPRSQPSPQISNENGWRHVVENNRNRRNVYSRPRSRCRHIRCRRDRFQARSDFNRNKNKL